MLTGYNIRGFLSPNAQMRMQQRGITMRLVLETLRKEKGYQGQQRTSMAIGVSSCGAMWRVAVCKWWWP